MGVVDNMLLPYFIIYSIWIFDVSHASYQRCGLGPGRSTQHSNGGQESVNNHPWSVAFMKNLGEDLHCSGAILDPTHIITAAHCMKINRRNVVKDDITIVLGASDLKDPKNIRRGVQNLSLIDY